MKLSLCLPATSWDPEWFLKCLFPFVNWCNTQGIETDLATWNERGNMSLMRERLAVGSPKLINDWTMNTPWNGTRPYDYMLWIDSDIRFEPADFQRLLDHDKDIVSGVYAIVLGYSPTDELMVTISSADLENRQFDATTTGLQESLWFGFGFCLIKRGVFERIPRPWFPTQQMDLIGRPSFCGEDIAWCSKAREAGFKLYTDCSLRLPHKKEIYVFLPKVDG